MSAGPHERAAAGWMVLAAASFAIMGTMAHHAGARVDWRWMLLARSGLAFLAMAALAPAATRAVLRCREPALWLRTAAGCGAVACTFYSLPRLPVTEAVTLRNTVPLWVGLLAPWATGRRTEPALWGAILAALLGVALLEGAGFSALSVPAAVMTLAAFLSAVAMLALHRLGHLDGKGVVAHFSGGSALLALGLVALGGGPPGRAGPLARADLAWLVGIAAAGCLAQVAVTAAYTRGTPVRVALAGLLQVCFAAALDAALLGTGFPPRRLAGVALIVAPSAWLIGRAAQPATDQEQAPAARLE